MKENRRHIYKDSAGVWYYTDTAFELTDSGMMQAVGVNYTLPTGEWYEPVGEAQAFPLDPMAYYEAGEDLQDPVIFVEDSNGLPFIRRKNKHAVWYATLEGLPYCPLPDGKHVYGFGPGPVPVGAGVEKGLDYSRDDAPLLPPDKKLETTIQINISLAAYIDLLELLDSAAWSTNDPETAKMLSEIQSERRGRCRGTCNDGRCENCKVN